MVEETSADELALVAHHNDFIARCGLAFDPLDRGDEDPGMPSEKRAGPTRFDHDANRRGHREGAFKRCDSAKSACSESLISVLKSNERSQGVSVLTFSTSAR